MQGVAGTWKDLTDSVNSMAGNLTAQVRNIADVTKAVAAGDLSKKITVDVKGEILELKNTINTMVDQLQTFAGGDAGGPRSGHRRASWAASRRARRGRHLEGPTDSVNSMAGNLTARVRNIADVIDRRGCWRPPKKITVDVKGEILSEEHHQHDGGPAFLLRLGSDPGGT